MQPDWDSSHQSGLCLKQKALQVGRKHVIYSECLIQYINLKGQSTFFFFNSNSLLANEAIYHVYKILILGSSSEPGKSIHPLPFHFSLAANLIVCGYLFQSI